MTMDSTKPLEDTPVRTTTIQETAISGASAPPMRAIPELNTSPLHGLWALTQRDLKKWYTNKYQLLISLIQPIVWLGIFGKALNFGAFISSAGGTQAEQNATLLSIFGTTSYFSFLAVGMLASIVLFTAAFSGMSVVFDRRFGFLNKVLSTPVSRGAVVVSKVLQSGVRSLVQSMMVLIIAALLGMDLSHFSVLGILGAFTLLFLMGFTLSSLFVTLALRSSDWQTQMAIINLLNLPLMFASNALFPIKIMPIWLQYVVRLNPISYAIDGARQLLLGSVGTNSLIVDFGVITAFAIVLSSISVVLSWKLLSK
jgi:ABC-2 type transport system permease protein